MPLSSRGSIAFYATIEFFSPFIRFEQALVWHAHHFDVKKNQKKSKKKKKNRAHTRDSVECICRSISGAIAI